MPVVIVRNMQAYGQNFGAVCDTISGPLSLCSVVLRKISSPLLYKLSTRLGQSFQNTELRVNGLCEESYLHIRVHSFSSIRNLEVGRFWLWFSSYLNMLHV